ncbi:MAG: YbaK/EbsC family protein [Burkholderiales bacterium]|jgi:prolyl-tRNA editing enzyme YbaK/EbsC (Cys-tRNA(Pro) deacylase)|nr:YbaK/EbsC family protein [Burkholderiales bacterium]
MGLESVRAHLAAKAPELKILELNEDTATVALAAVAHGVEPGRIAKTLAFSTGQGAVLVVARGDARVDNKKMKATFGGKPKMLNGETVEKLTGHPVGGVCPFGLASEIPVYLDRTLNDFDEILPAAGGIHTAVRLTPARLAALTGDRWVDVCQSVLAETGDV